MFEQRSFTGAKIIFTDTPKRRKQTVEDEYAAISPFNAMSESAINLRISQLKNKRTEVANELMYIDVELAALRAVRQAKFSPAAPLFNFTAPNLGNSGAFGSNK